MKARLFFLIATAGLLVASGTGYLLRDFFSGVTLNVCAAAGGSITALLLHSFFHRLRSKVVRAFIGPILLFLALCIGLPDQGKLLGISVLWAGLIFGVVEALAQLNEHGLVSDHLRNRAEL